MFQLELGASVAGSSMTASGGGVAEWRSGRVAGVV